MFDILRNELPLEIRTTYYSGNKDQREAIKNYVENTYMKRYPDIKYIEQDDVRILI